MTVAAPPASSVLADLLLARLLVSGKNPPGPKRLRDDLGKLLGSPLSAEAVDAIVVELLGGELVTKRPLRLTDAGRSRALEFLGVTDLPPRATWATVQTKLLLPRVIGIHAADLARISSGDQFAALLLKQQYDLPPDTGSSVRQVMEALTCRELGYPGETTLDGLMENVLARSLKFEQRLKVKDLVKQIPCKEFAVPDSKLDTLRRAVLAKWCKGKPPVKDEVEFDLPMFARTVQTLARSSPASDRFGPNKVFIVAVWQGSQQEPSFPAMTLDEFKTRLIEANHAGLLQLSRADMPQAMNPDLVDRSRTDYLNATFHFILVEGGQP